MGMTPGITVSWVVEAGGGVGDGSVCSGCGCFNAEFVDGRRGGGLIRPGEPWDLGHDDCDRSRYRGGAQAV